MDPGSLTNFAKEGQSPTSSSAEITARRGGAALGYDFDTLASDLNTLLTTLNLTDVSLVGFSMGTGEVTRYIGKYGTKRVRKAALIGTIGPYLVKAADNPEGIDPSVFDGVKTAIKKDRPAALYHSQRVPLRCPRRQADERTRG